MEPVQGALVSITAKVMVIVDALLGWFVTTPEMVIGGACNIPAINADLTGCGALLVDQLAVLIYYLVQLGGQFLPALGVITGPIATP